VVSLLIQYGADVNARNKEGITPLDWARSNNHPDTETLLLANGAVVGKPLPPKSRSRPSGVGASVAQNPGRYLLSNSGQYRERPPQKPEPEASIEEDVIERPIQQEELDRLESVSQINQMMVKYRKGQALPTTGAAEPASTGEAELGTQEEELPASEPGQSRQQETAIASQAYRIQLAAVSKYDRAEVLRAEYAQRYSDILGEATLVVEPVNIAQRKLYRLRSSALSGSQAASVCEQLKRRNQDCMIVAPSKR
jgi:cell division septation protein DedD